MTIFASDNVTAACPEVIQAINNANNGNVDSYGDDQWTNNLERKFSELFEKKIKVFTVITGTAANSLALSAITPNCAIIAAILCFVRLTLPSPVFARPITKPYPTSCFDRTPASEAISFILSAKQQLFDKRIKVKISDNKDFIILKW